jgi:hypothetical protein
MTRRNDGPTTGMSNAERLRFLRADAVGRGLCLGCRCRKPRDGVKTCDVCLQRVKDRIEENRLIGKCDCGRRPVPGLTQCRRCKDINALSEKRSRKRWIDSGVCPRCRTAPLATGRRACEPCLREAARLLIEHYWSQRPVRLRRSPTCSVCGEVGHRAGRHPRPETAP